MRITHPFHPLAGMRLRRVGERCNLMGQRVLCLDEKDALWAVPIEWTDLAPAVPEYVLSAGRAYFLVGDLLSLAQLVGQRDRS